MHTVSITQEINIPVTNVGQALDDFGNIDKFHPHVEEYRRNAFGIGGVTNAVEQVGGRKPEDFETITRRYVAERTEAKSSLTNKLKAMWNFMQILLTPVPDLDRYEQNRNHPIIAQPIYVPDFSSWMNTHSVEGAFSTSF